MEYSHCDNATKPLEQRHCANSICKGAWLAGNWSEVTFLSTYLIFNRYIVTLPVFLGVTVRFLILYNHTAD